MRNFAWPFFSVPLPLEKFQFGKVELFLCTFCGPLVPFLALNPAFFICSLL